MDNTKLKIITLIISAATFNINIFAYNANNNIGEHAGTIKNSNEITDNQTVKRQNYNKIYSNTDTTAILLDQVNISASISQINKSPLRIKTITKQDITTTSTGKTFPELMNMTPGVYASSETGSYGDAKINIRGFKQENISVLLNGIPISGLTSGSMFWNNWIGLTDATDKIELSKGIGNSMLSENSVGGTINVITQSPKKNQSLNIGYSYTNYNISKLFFNYNSGELKNGWAISLMGSYVLGKSHVECSDVNSSAYLLSLSKKLKNHHSLLFTALGSPEKHKQRSVRLSYAEIEQYGRNYNKNWGYYNGEEKTISENNYFKPYFTLSHFWDTHTGSRNQNKIYINNSIYLAIGNGGGIWTESKGKSIIHYQKEGHIDWNSVISDNRNVNSSTNSPYNESQNIISQFMAGHTQAGIKSSILIDFDKKIELDVGLHYQIYNTWENEKITDLLGGDFWYEDYANNSLAGQSARDSYKQIGDYIRTDNGRKMNYLTIYAMSSYFIANNRLVLKLGVSGSGSFIRRWDKYNYIDNIYSELAKGVGGSIKSGILYKFDKMNSVYINAAAYSRTPYANIIFKNGNNEISNNLKNESNYLGELGYRIVGNNFSIETTLYSALWKDKSVTKNPYSKDYETERYTVTGLDAFHYGGEVEAYYSPVNYVKLSTYISIGEWRWKSDATVTIFDNTTNLPKDDKIVYCKGLHVGDAPQTQIGVTIEVNPFRALYNKGKIFNIADFKIKVNWNYNDRHWADFNPINRTDINDRNESYRIPEYHILNLSFTWEQTISNRLGMILFCNINNLLDSEYIERSKDGKNHKRETFTGYWGAPRNISFGIKKVV